VIACQRPPPGEANRSGRRAAPLVVARLRSTLHVNGDREQERTEGGWMAQDNTLALPSDESPRDLAGAQRQLTVLQWVIPGLTGRRWC
jgi:hypothetical protein